MKKISMLKALMLCLAIAGSNTLQAQKITWGESYLIKKGFIHPSALSFKNDIWECTAHARTGSIFDLKISTKFLSFDRNLKFIKEISEEIDLRDKMKTSSKSYTIEDISEGMYDTFVKLFKDLAQNKTLYDYGLNFFNPDLPLLSSHKTTITKDSNLIIADIQEAKNSNTIKYTTFNKMYEIKEGSIQLPPNYESIALMGAFTYQNTQIQFILKHGKKEAKVLLLSYDVQTQKLETTPLPLAKSLAYKGFVNNQTLYILSVEPSSKKNYSDKVKVSTYDMNGKFIKEQVNSFSADFKSAAKSENGLVNFKDWEFSDDIAINDYGQIVANAEYHKMTEISTSSGPMMSYAGNNTQGMPTYKPNMNRTSSGTGMYVHEYGSSYIFLIDANNLGIKNFVIRKSQSGSTSTYLRTQTFSNGKDFFIFYNDHKKNVNLSPSKSPQKYTLNNSVLRVQKLTPDGIFEEKALIAEQSNKKIKDAVINLKSIRYSQQDKVFYGAGSNKNTLGILRIDVQ